jgi:hypothetical protein
VPRVRPRGWDGPGGGGGRAARGGGAGAVHGEGGGGAEGADLCERLAWDPEVDLQRHALQHAARGGCTQHVCEARGARSTETVPRQRQHPEAPVLRQRGRERGRARVAHRVG